MAVAAMFLVLGAEVQERAAGQRLLAGGAGLCTCTKLILVGGPRTSRLILGTVSGFMNMERRSEHDCIAYTCDREPLSAGRLHSGGGGVC